MREIKFRAWDTTSEIMIDDVLSISWSEKRIFYKKDGLICSQHMDYIILMQYTGLKDKKNEKDALYHKDIVLVVGHYIGDHWIEPQKGIVEWVEDGWAVVDSKGEYICGLFDYIYNNCGGKIGNIHDNPELI